MDGKTRGGEGKWALAREEVGGAKGGGMDLLWFGYQTYLLSCFPGGLQSLLHHLRDSFDFLCFANRQ